MAQDLNRIKRTYDRIAVDYAREFYAEHEKKPMDRELLSRFALEIGASTPVWDLGCGPGQTTNFLHDLGVEVSGLDLSGRMVEQARHTYPGIRFRQGNMLALPFDDGALAGAVSFYAIVHFTADQVEMALRQVYRVLQPGGLFLFTFHVGAETIQLDEYLGKDVEIDFMLHTTALVAGCLAEIGFEAADIIERDPYPDVEYESRRAYVFATKPPRVGGASLDQSSGVRHVSP